MLREQCPSITRSKKLVKRKTKGVLGKKAAKKPTKERSVNISDDFSEFLDQESEIDIDVPVKRKSARKISKTRKSAKKKRTKRKKGVSTKPKKKMIFVEAEDDIQAEERKVLPKKRKIKKQKKAKKAKKAKKKGTKSVDERKRGVSGRSGPADPSRFDVTVEISECNECSGNLCEVKGKRGGKRWIACVNNSSDSCNRTWPMALKGDIFYINEICPSCGLPEYQVVSRSTGKSGAKYPQKRTTCVGWINCDLRQKK